MEIVILIAAMVVVGVLIGALSPKIFKGDPPYGVRGEYIGSIVAAVLVGLMDWFLIPAIIEFRNNQIHWGGNRASFIFSAGAVVDA